MPQLFMVNPPKRGKSRKRRTPAQRRATAKMIAANKKKRRSKSTTTRRKKRAPTMARRKKRSTARRSTAKRRSSPRRRRSVKRRSPITRLRRHSVYMTNRPRRRRKRYGINPRGGIVGQVMQGVKDAGATLVGGALARTAVGFVPLPNTGLTGAMVGVGVAVGLGMVARKVVSGDTARFITAGAMQVPLKALITSFVPSAGAFLGDYDNIGVYGQPGVAGYLDSVSDPSDHMASYMEEGFANA